ncbi:MAG: restriction endonuclease subunit S [Prevotellaceae bacterium]|jgi:type I restriction enzyme S subunit|nr:restriction endonuclease subunit S [Prevotellaceae bacterium]
MTAQELRKSILQLAIQGKLVKQNPDDEPASALIERIRAEKQRLIKEGKIKKDKTESFIYRGADNSYYEKIGNTIRCIDEEIPFEVPEGWEWCKLGTISDVYRGITFPSNVKYKTYRQGLVCCATTGSVQKEYNSNADVYVPIQYVKNEKQWLKYNDIIMSSANSRELVGKTCMWKQTEQKSFGGFLTVIRTKENVLSDFLYYVLQQLWVTGAFNKNSTQTTNIANINNSILSDYLIPIPPFNEQNVIVAKITNFEPYINQYAQIEQQETQLQIEFPDTLKKSILQSAIQGKLVAQNPDDEPASASLEKIRKEKEQLIKAGKLKRDKNESFIYKDAADNSYYESRNGKVLCIDDEIPFEIPDNWAWCRLYSITNYIQRGKSPIYSTVHKYPVIAQKCIQWTGISLEKALFIEPLTISKYLPERFIQEGDILINSTGTGTLGRIGYFTNDVKGEYDTIVADSHVTVVRCSNLISSKYISLFFCSPLVQNEIENKADGSTNQIELNTESVKSYIIPLPPLNEQNRIIKKIEQLFAVLS